MAACTFFGHRECPENIKGKLKDMLVSLITEHNVDMFYVGNQGQFDAYVRACLRTLSAVYPHIRYAVVLAYMPGTCKEYEDMSDTMLPEGIEAIHPRFAIGWRNDWMIRQSDYVVTFITHTWGGAAKYADAARKRGKQIIALV